MFLHWFTLFKTYFGKINSWYQKEKTAEISKRKHQPKSFRYIHYKCYRAFYGFGQAKNDYGGSILRLSQFTLLPELPLKMALDLNVVKIDSL